MDNMISDKEDWYDTLKKYDDGLIQTPFDEYGNYRHRTVPEHVQVLPPIPEELEVTLHDTHDLRTTFDAAADLNALYVEHVTELEAFQARETVAKAIDYNKYRPYFLHVNLDKI
jgi:hypothetical protein